MKILNKPTATLKQAIEWAKSKKCHSLALEVLPILWEEAIEVNVDPIVAIAQACKETGYFKFGGVLDATFFNTCGLKGSLGGSDTDPKAHTRFACWEDGCSAHVDHLALYAGGDGYPSYITKDPRHFPYLHGKCPNVEDLSGNWAPGVTYGTDVVRMCTEISNIEVIEEDLTCDCDILMQEISKLKSIIEENNKVIREKDILLEIQSNSIAEKDISIVVLKTKVTAFVDALNNLKI